MCNLFCLMTPIGSGAPAGDQRALQRGRQALHARGPRAQAAGEAAGFPGEVGADTARDLRAEPRRGVSSHLRAGPGEAARCHAAEVQPEGLQDLHARGRDGRRGSGR